jgi:hypothetical protein
MADQPSLLRRFRFGVFRALWLMRQALLYDIAPGLKRPFQFSMRTLFVLVTVAALLCPLGVWLVHQWQARPPWILALRTLLAIGVPVVGIVGVALMICKTTSAIISDREIAKSEDDIEQDGPLPDDPTPPPATQP